MRLEPDSIRRLHNVLAPIHGQDRETSFSPIDQLARDPLDTLVITILSQATSDSNCRRAFLELRSRFPSWEEVLAAPVEEVERAISVGGLAGQKAPRIQEILRRLDREQGRPSLEFLRDWPPRKARDYLASLPGVGPKTAACVLLFALDMPAFPVDTHILRVARRLGLVDDRAGAAATQRELEEVVPPDVAYPLHLNLIEHGRKFCRPQDPRCQACPLGQECRYAAAGTTVPTSR